MPEQLSPFDQYRRSLPQNIGEMSDSQIQQVYGAMGGPIDFLEIIEKMVLMELIGTEKFYRALF